MGEPADVHARALRSARTLALRSANPLDLRRRARRVAYYDALAQQRIDRGLRLLGSARFVITDRLHGHILCTLMGIPHAVLDNSYGKIARFARAFATVWDGVVLADGLTEAIGAAEDWLARNGGAFADRERTGQMGMTTLDNRAAMTGQPLATVTICTRNRAASLARTLASIVEAARAVSEDWELLVVDNGSTDDTSEVVDGFAGCLPIHRILHSVPGLSNARNAGVAAARGRFIIWTDDDLTVDRAWLAAYLAAFRTWPDCAIFGGRAIPPLRRARARVVFWHARTTSRAFWRSATRPTGTRSRPSVCPMA